MVAIIGCVTRHRSTSTGDVTEIVLVRRLVALVPDRPLDCRSYWETISVDQPEAAILWRKEPDRRQAAWKCSRENMLGSLTS